MQPDGANDFVDIRGGSQWIIDDCGRACDLSINPVLGFCFLRLVVNQNAKLRSSSPGPPLLTSSGTRSAKDPATGFTVLCPPAP